MGASYASAPLRRHLALCLLHPEYHPAWHRHHAQFMCEQRSLLEQDADGSRLCLDAYSCLHRWLDLFHLVGLAHPTKGHRRQARGPVILAKDRC